MADPEPIPVSEPLTVLCIASYEKGQEFMCECKRQGCRTLLVTSQSLQNADWPRESLDEIYYIPDRDKEWNFTDMLNGISYLARTVTIDRVVPLDDFDVEKAAAIREHLRLPGMGDSVARFFRDKLAMRTRAADTGIPVPPFIGIINYDRLRHFLSTVPPPYVLKPRSQAGAIGIRKIADPSDLWTALDELGDRQSHYLLEKFVPGSIYHVDTIVHKGKVVFSLVSRYGTPPLAVSHEGRVFTSRNVVRGSEDEKDLTALNKKVLKSFGLEQGVSHSEYIRGDDGQVYFLETSARVAGAHLAEMIEAASGVNLWAEWAKLETRRNPAEYQPPTIYRNYAALLVSLAKQEHPEMSIFTDPEVYWTLKKSHHAGVVIRSPKYDRITELLDTYTERFYSEFFTSLLPTEKAVD